MSYLLALLIVAAQPPAPIEVRLPDAVQIYHCRFDEAADHDLDAWPDGWIRQRGPRFPVYLPIKIVETEAPEGHTALSIKLNGAAAAIRTPPIPVGSQFSYVLEGFIKTEGLKHDHAYFSLSLFDAHSKLVETFTSERLETDGAWRKVRLGPVAAPGDLVNSAVIGLHVEPDGDQADLRGTALFDDIWLARLPRMSLTTNRPDNVYTDPQEIELACEISGVFEQKPVMRCQLFDAAGHEVGEPSLRPLEARPAGPVQANVPRLNAEDVRGDSAFVGSMRWKPKITEPGFYRARVALEGEAGKIVERQCTLAVVVPAPAVAHGEFGWTLPRGDQPLSYTQLARLLSQVGVNWVKFPVWLGEKEMNKLDAIVDFTERLSSRGIESVGLLTDPPADIRPQFGDAANLTAAAIFSTEPELWYPSLEEVTTRLSLEVRWWQLGADADASFVGDADLTRHIGEVKKQLEQFGQSIHLGFPWRTLDEVPASATPPWSFLYLAADPPMTADELTYYLPAEPESPVARWVNLAPLARRDYAMADRAADLIQRMVAAKRLGAKGIFIPDPFDRERGLMNPDGTPSELLVPWRTAALALAGAEYLGSLSLGGGSHNHLFSRNGEIVMVLWNDHPTEEHIYLGENVRQTDAWGKSTQPTLSGHEQIVPVGPVPTFLSGISEPIVRWSMEFAFDAGQLPSIFGTSHPNGIRLKNFFPQGTAGQIRLHTPEEWQTTPRVLNFKLAAGETLHEPLTIRLPFDATNGRFPVRVDFDLTADHDYHFSVYRELEVGLGDITIEMSSRLNDQGDLEVEQFFTNKTDALVSFKCSLYAPDRRRQGTQVTRLGPQRDTKRYRFPNGRELIGKTLSLRAEEIGGERSFNYRFIAKE